MENYTFNLNEADIEQELRCVICLTLPSAPLQCQGCDSIMCKECSKSMGSPFNCPLRCKNPNYGKVKPKTMLLFDHLKLRCEKCLETFKCLEFAKHKAKCGRKSSIFASNDDNESIEESTALPFHHYPRSNPRKKPAKMMKKKFVEASPGKTGTNPFDHYQKSNSRRKPEEVNRKDSAETTLDPDVRELLDYYIPDSQKKPAKMMRKKTVETTPEPLQTPLILDDDVIEIIQPDQVYEGERESLECQWSFSGLVIGLITLFMMWKIASTGIEMIFLDSNLKFKWICKGYDEVEMYDGIHDLCFFSYGGLGVGIIAVGQFAVGLISFCQVGIGLLFGFGQAIGGCGVTIGQIAASFYVHAGMVGVAFYRAKYAMGVHFLYPFLFNKSYCAQCNRVDE